MVVDFAMADDATRGDGVSTRVCAPLFAALPLLLAFGMHMNPALSDLGRCLLSAEVAEHGQLDIAHVG